MSSIQASFAQIPKARNLLVIGPTTGSFVTDSALATLLATSASAPAIKVGNNLVYADATHFLAFNTFTGRAALVIGEVLEDMGEDLTATVTGVDVLLRMRRVKRNLPVGSAATPSAVVGWVVVENNTVFNTTYSTTLTAAVCVARV